MNKHLHRIIFNAARGMRMVVQETATSTGKGASKATGKTAPAAAATAVIALFGVLAALPGQAQIVPSPMVPGNLRPNVLVAPNGVPLVNIQTPSAAGVSRNVYNQFDVMRNGAILNNSRVNVQTQLGGFVQGNPWLANGPARIILNEINGGNPTQLRGYVEVGGQRAEVIIANPAGISVDGGGFINASRATLTTGTPQLNAMGGLDSFLVRGGTISIDGAGLDASKTDYAAILARAVQVNAGIWASELKVVAGGNQVSADHGSVTPTAGTGPAPTFALDVAALGGMYANKITLIGTEAGLGVRNAGNVGAGAGGLVVTAQGRLENTGTLEGARVELVSSADISNRGGTIRQTNMSGLTIDSPVLRNTNGSVIGVEPVTSTPSSGTAGTGSVGGTPSNPGTSDPVAPGGSGASGGTSPTQPYVPPAPGIITAAGAIQNDGGRIYAGGPITLKTPQISNAGGTLSVASMAVTGPEFSNAGGTLSVSDTFQANVGRFDNTGGKLSLGAGSITTSGDLVNTDGAIQSIADLSLSVSGSLFNQRGNVSTPGALNATVGGTLDNTSGNLLAGSGLGVQANTLTSSGSMRAGTDASISAVGAMTNNGSITAARHVTIAAGSLQGGTSGVLGAGVQSSDSSLGAVGDLRVTTTGALVSQGKNIAPGAITFQGASVDIASSRTDAAGISLTATQGDVITGGATVTTPGTLAITANGQSGQTLVNAGGHLNADVLQIRASNIANTADGELIQTGTNALTLATTGSLRNDGGRIATNAQDLTLQGASVGNAAGKIEHAGTGALRIAGGSFDGAGGKITTNGALDVDVTGAFNQANGSTQAQQITLKAGSLDNQGGSLVQLGTGATTFAVVGAINNNAAAGTGKAATITSNGSISIAADSLSNQGSLIQTGGTSDLVLGIANALDNSAGGQILAGGNASLDVGSFNNDSGKTTAVGDLTVKSQGAISNKSGTLAGKANTTITAASFNNDAGTTAAVTGNLLITTTGAATNVGGSMQAAGTTTLDVGSLDNRSSGKILGTGVSVNAHSGALKNAGGSIVSNTTLSLKSGALTNDAGAIQSIGAMSIDTGGQSISNTDAAGYANKQGGIVSGDTLTITSAALDNSAGFIGSVKQLTATTDAFTNIGGQVQGQADVTLDARGAAFDNTRGLVRATGNTRIGAGGLVNASTQLTDRGIEGENVTLNVASLTNTSGAVRANKMATVNASGRVDNTGGGLISAGEAVAIVDTNASVPSAKALEVTNAAGTLQAGKSIRIDAAKADMAGTMATGSDLTVALTQNVTNNQTLSVSGNLSYTTTGNFTNNGGLLAGQTLVVGGNDVDNTANAEMSGASTTVNAGGTLTNRGLIDSKGATQINAGALKNIGTGRIYGNDISIAATGTLDNEAETLNGVTKAGTIAARGTLNIGADTINNREHSLIFSGDSMRIGKAIDANRQATGQGSVLNNLSADIESLGDMSISMVNVNNRDVHIQKGAATVTPSVLIGAAPVTPVGSGIGRTSVYLLNEVNLDAANGFIYRVDTGELVGIGGYGIWTNYLTTTEDTAINVDPAHLVAGGSMTVNGRLYNENSQVLAGKTITATEYVPSQLTGVLTVTGNATVTNNKGETMPGLIPLVVAPKTLDLGAYKYQENINATNGYNAGSAALGSSSGAGGGAGSASGRPGTIVEVTARVGGVDPTQGNGASTAQGGSGAGGAGSIPMVVRTSAPNVRVPTASLFNIRASGSSYLIETDPRFASYRNWLSSDYLLNNLGQNPNNILKRLGDGFYEQKLIREQVAQLTGYRYLDGFSSDDEQYMALMDAGATFAKQYGLRPGVALSAAQMAQLTSDIVWLVEQTVTLPDGSTQRALVPQVYVRVRPGDIDGSGALLSADATLIKSPGDLTNTGTIAGRSMVSINAENVNNLGGRIVGGSIGINARNDLNNIGGTITARDAAVLTAGRDINIQTTTQTAGSSTAIDRVAGVYVTNPGGVLIASAGRDTNLIGAALVSAGSASVGAGRNINLGTVTEGHTIVAAGKGWAGISSESREVGSVIQGQDNVRLAAGNDLNIRAGAVASVDGALIASAKNDINVTAGQSTTSAAAATQSSSKTLFKKSSSSTLDSSSATDVLSSSLSGKSVALVAGNDINLQAAQLHSDEAMSLSAGRDINLTTANRTNQELHAAQSRSSGTVFGQLAAGATFAGDATAVAIASNKKSANHADASISTQAVGTSISAGSLQMVSGRDTTLQAATVVADKDITLLAGRNLTIESAQNTSIESSYNANSKSGMVGTWYNPAIGNVKGSEANATTRTTQQASQVASLQGNVTLVAGNEYRQTASSIMAAGQAGPLVGGDVNILAKNVVINEAYNTTQSVTVDKNSSTIVGGSASFMGVSTDTLKGASSTIKAMGNTGDGRMQALGVVNLAMSGKQAYEATQAIGGTGQLSYGVSVNVSRNTSQATSFTNSSQAVGSSVVGANNVNIVATGGGEGSNIRAVGSTIAAGNTVNLAADNDVTLEASRNTSMTAGQNSSHGSNVGVTFGAGAQNGFSIQLGVSNGKGKNDQNDVSYNATQVSGGKAVNISSGGDLNMRGATVEANRVTADVGRNLNIESLQDVSVGQSRQSSSGFNVSLCIPPICYGAVATVSGSAAGAKADGIFVSPAVQSGIKAGDGGFDVKVAGNTDLKGAVIESTQAAIDAGKNSFSTGGALTMADLQNVSQSSGSSYSVSGGLSVGYTTAPNAQTNTPMQTSWTNPNGAIPPSGSAGVGSYSGNNQTSVTKSGISGIAGDQSVRTGDNSSAGTLIKDWNTQTIIKDVQAQAQLTQQFNQNASREIGTYAGNQTRKYEIAQSGAKTAQGVLNDPAASDQAKSVAQTQLNAARQTMAAEQATYDHWKEGGDYRVALHTAAGALGGGVAGALGAGASAALMPRVGEAIGEMGLPAPVAQALGAVTAAAIGGLAGGTAGASSAYSVEINNRQLHPNEAKRIQELAGGDPIKEARLTAAACALVHCADGVPPSAPEYAYLAHLQDAGRSMIDEISLLSRQTEKQSSGDVRLFDYDKVDGVKDWAGRNALATRTIGAVQGAAGTLGVLGSAGLCSTGLGCFVGAVGGTVSADYAQTGIKQALTGQGQTPYGQQVFESLGLSPGAAAYSYAALGVAPIALEGVALMRAASAASQYNSLARASYSDFATSGVPINAATMGSPPAQALISEIKAASPGLSEATVNEIAAGLIASGKSLPSVGTAVPGSVLVKVVPKGDGVSAYSPYWMSAEQARAIAAMGPTEAGIALGLPAAQAAKIFKDGMDFYAIAARSGAPARVFVSDIAPTTQGGVTTAPVGRQVLVPNRSAWSPPVQINPYTLGAF